MESAIEVYRQAREIALQAGRPDLAAVAPGKIGNVYQFCYSDLENAVASYKEAIKLGRESDDIFLQTKNLNNIANIRYSQGRLEEAARLLFEAVDVGRGRIPPTTHATLQCNLCELYLRLGDIDRARRLLAEAEATFEQYDEPHGRARVHVHRASLLKKKRLFAQAENELQLALTAHEKLKDRTEVARVLDDLERQRADHPQSTHYLDRSLAEWRALGDRASQARVMVALAEVRLVSGDPDGAAPLLEDAISFCRSGGFDLVARRAYELLADLHEGRGDPQAALEWERHARDLEELGVGEVSEGMVGVVLERERAASEEILETKRRTFIAWTTGAGVLIAALLLLLTANVVRLSRARRRAARTIERQAAAMAWQKDQLDALIERERRPPTAPNGPRYCGSRLTGERAKNLLSRLVALVEDSRLYLDPDLTLAALAERLEINRTYLSRAINEHLKQSFTDYINGLRVEEAAARLVHVGDRPDSVLAICFDVGFNSKSAFYRAFKARYNTTPAAYRRACQTKNAES